MRPIDLELKVVEVKEPRTYTRMDGRESSHSATRKLRPSYTSIIAIVSFVVPFLFLALGISR